MTNPNCLLAGVVGKGKSFLAKSLTTRSLPFGRRVYVPGDPKGECTAVAHAVAHALGGAAIALGDGTTNRLNPLDPGPRATGMTDEAWRAEVTRRRRTLLGSLAEAALRRPLAAAEHTALDAAVAHAVSSSSTPTLPTVVDALLDPRVPVGCRSTCPPSRAPTSSSPWS